MTPPDVRSNALRSVDFGSTVLGYAVCDACGVDSQFRLMLCHSCWRRLPPGLVGAWLACRTARQKLAAAAAIFAWARTTEHGRQRRASAGR